MKIKNWIFASFVLLIISMLMSGFRVKINLSESLPNYCFLSHPFKSLTRDEFVSFALPHSSTIFAKCVAGIPGDFIEVLDGQVYINGIQKGKKGIPSTLSYLPSGEIPEGYFFALGLSANSLDSRYRDFGLVPLSHVKERLWSIF